MIATARRLDGTGPCAFLLVDKINLLYHIFMTYPFTKATLKNYFAFILALSQETHSDLPQKNTRQLKKMSQGTVP
jgi:hypothetical protein